MADEEKREPDPLPLQYRGLIPPQSYEPWPALGCVLISGCVFGFLGTGVVVLYVIAANSSLEFVPRWAGVVVSFALGAGVIGLSLGSGKKDAGECRRSFLAC
jgi:hypothetical protein